jgi:hypothetical protein
MDSLNNSDSGNYEIGAGERTRQRIELIRLFCRLGIKETEVIQRLQDGGYIPLSWDFKKKRRLIRKDIKKAKSEDLDRYKQLMSDADGALVEYIGKLEVIFEKAYEDGNWYLCRDLTKDLARAHGVPTEEPIRIETDILSQMQIAFQAGMKKINEQKNLPPPIDVSDKK